MRRDSLSRSPGRPRRLPLRFEALEDRVQPNDMLGLGTALLTSWSALDFEAPVEPAELVREFAAEDTGLIGEIGAAESAPFPFDAETRSEEVAISPVVVDTSAELVLNAVNAQDFNDDLAADLVQNTRLEKLQQRVRATLQNLETRGAAVALPGQGGQSLGRAGQPMARQSGLADSVQNSLLAALNRLSEKAVGGEGGSEIQGGFATLTDGATIASVNTYGQAGWNSPGCMGIGAGFTVGGAGNLCEGQDYITSGGPVLAVNSTNCTVDIPIQTAGDNVAISAVTCSGTTILYIQYVDGTAQSWTTIPIVYSAQPVCMYSYTDYDIFGFANNGGSYQAGSAQFVIRNNATSPNVHFTFAGFGLQSHWEQDEFDDLRAKIEGFSNCGNLADGTSLHTGDWTGALQFPLPANPNEGSIAIYARGRDDNTSFP